MKINKDVIKALKPCEDRYENYLKFYKEKEFTPAQFMGLKNITQADKCWVAFRLIPKDKIRFVAADIAESVLPIFEAKYPGDLRPRNAIEAVKSGNADADAAAYAADAYSDAYSDASYAAAYAAAAAASSAYAASSAASASASAAYAAASADAAANVRPDQEKLIRKILLRYLR